MANLDTDGQPRQAFNQASNLKKATESLLGICKGMAADHTINEQEVLFLDTWLRENDQVTKHWPGSIIADRVQRVLADGVVTSEEANDLLETLSEITGMDLDQGIVSGLANTSGADDTPPPVQFRNRSFCFTGKFVYGPRKTLEAAIRERGGHPEKNVTDRLDYLVIGGLASRDWAHTSHGRKIEAAVAKREAGSNIIILEEENWAAAL